MDQNLVSGFLGSAPASAALLPRVLVLPRPALEAAARCAAYAACSELVASPHDLDVRSALAGRIPALAGLSQAATLPAVMELIAASGLDALRLDYSGLFEVGSEGPPVPIREDLQTGQLSGTREDLVRFYDFFGYRLEDRFAWAPDHLSVELEFMHLLCFREAEASTGAGTGNAGGRPGGTRPDVGATPGDAAGAAAGAGSGTDAGVESGRGADALSFALAQLDFTSRHLARFVPLLAAATQRHAAGSPYARVLAAIDEFVRADHAWQQSTIGPGSVAA